MPLRSKVSVALDLRGNAPPCLQQEQAVASFIGQPDIWSSRALTLSVKMHFFQCIVVSVLLCFGETQAVVKQHISPLAVFQMNCLRRICGISLRDHVLDLDMLNRCNTLSVESQLQYPICGVSAARQKIQKARSCFQDA